LPDDGDYNQLVERRQRKSTKSRPGRRPPDPAFGERLAAARRQAGLTQRELAGRAGVTLNSVWRYETGRRPEDYEVLARLAEAVSVGVDFLLRGGGAPQAGVAEEHRTWDAALRPLLASSGLRLAAGSTMRTRLNRAWRALDEERKEEVRTLIRRAVALAAAVEHLLPEASARAVNQELSAELSATVTSRILRRS
jgi:transcriptional regulator with XRE-family HTH domain